MENVPARQERSQTLGLEAREAAVAGVTIAHEGHLLIGNGYIHHGCVLNGRCRRMATLKPELRKDRLARSNLGKAARCPYRRNKTNSLL